MKAASCAVISSAGGNTRSAVAANAGSSASPATVNSSGWKRGCDAWLSQRAAVGRSPGWPGALIVTGPGFLTATRGSRSTLKVRPSGAFAHRAVMPTMSSLFAKTCWLRRCLGSCSWRVFAHRSSTRRRAIPTLTPLKTSSRRMRVLSHQLKGLRMRGILRVPPRARLGPAAGAVERTCHLIVGQ
jgi:hypothetical protein